MSTHILTKIKILFVFISFSFLLLNPLKINAQVTSPTAPQFTDVVAPQVPQPGINCGTLTQGPANKCCEFKKIIVAVPTGFSLPLDYFGTGMQTLNSYLNSSVQPLVDPINTAVSSTMQPCLEGVPLYYGGNLCVCTPPEAAGTKSLNPLCKTIPGPNNPNGEAEKDLCEDCHRLEGVWTAVGCVYTKPEAFLKKTVFAWGIGIAGSLGLLCIIYAAFSIQTSRGNAEKVKKSQELLTSCISGLLLIIFSVFILRVIGVNILQIPFLN